MKLYNAELERAIKSLIYLITIFALLLFMHTQDVFPTSMDITAPDPSAKSYGMKMSNDPALIMPEAAQSLFGQYKDNYYTTYPNGFIKTVKLSQSDREKMGAIVSQLSAGELSEDITTANDALKEQYELSITGDNAQILNDGSLQIISSDTPEAIDSFFFDESITWEQFSALMAQADELLGGGSDFSTQWMNHRFGNIPMTYEEALADYELIRSEDKITGAQARLFSDYAGIILGLIPVFPAVFLFLKDRKNIAPMLYTRRISATRFVLTRYAALMTAIMLPLFILCAVQTAIHVQTIGASNIDLFAYFKYALVWLMPTVMASTAVGMFFTTLTGTPIAIGVQFLWWFSDMNGGSSTYSFYGVLPTQLMPRHNALGKTAVFLEYLPSLLQNRLIISLAALALVALTIFVFMLKRRGMLHAPVLKNSSLQPSL